MTSGSMKAKIVRVRIEKGREGLFYATSPDLKGLLVAEQTQEALEKSIPKTIAALYAAFDMEVEVTEADQQDDETVTPWVAIPVSATNPARAKGH